MENVLTLDDMKKIWAVMQDERGKNPYAYRSYLATWCPTNYDVWTSLSRAARYWDTDVSDVNNPNHGRKINVFEIGCGIGFGSFYWLAVDDNIQLTSIDGDSNIVSSKNMAFLKDIYPTNLRYEHIYSKDYEWEYDINRGQYDIVTIDSSVDTVHEDLKLAEKMDPKLIWIMNIDTAGGGATAHNAVASSLKDENFNYEWGNNIIYKTDMYYPDKDSPEKSGKRRVWTCNSALLQRKPEVE